MSDVIREAFERLNIVPEDAEYNDGTDCYRYETHPGVNHPFNEVYASFQVGWQAALENAGRGSAVKCFLCDGDGHHPEPIGMNAVCCRQPNPDGSCCGEEDAEPEWGPCEQCGGSGVVYTQPPAPVVPCLNSMIQWSKGWREFDSAESWTTEDRILYGASRCIHEAMLNANPEPPHDQ